MPEELAASLRLVLVTPGDREPAPTEELVARALDGGVTAVLLREPQLAEARRAELATRCAARCREAGALCLLSRDADLAQAVGAAGVHLGHGSAAPDVVRSRHPALIVGRSAHWPLVADDAEADYVTLSPFRPTHRSHPRALLGTGDVAHVLRTLHPRPVVALGGITAHDVQDLPDGLAGVAVMRALCDAPDVRGSAAVLRSLVDAWLAFGACR